MMNLDEIKLLSNEEIKFAVAKVFGWERDETKVPYHQWKRPDYPRSGFMWGANFIPDYPHDLNAVHEAMSRLDDVTKTAWAGWLYEIARANHHDKDVAMSTATARQRCEALLLTLS